MIDVCRRAFSGWDRQGHVHVRFRADGFPVRGRNIDYNGSFDFARRSTMPTMTTRLRSPSGFLAGALLALTALLAACGGPSRTEALEVTYYYLPG
jgi:hypothetical protein